MIFLRLLIPLDTCSQNGGPFRRSKLRSALVRFFGGSGPGPGGFSCDFCFKKPTVLNQNPTAAPEADSAVETRRFSMRFFSKSGKVGTPQIGLFFQGKRDGISMEFPPPEMLINVRGNQRFPRFLRKSWKSAGADLGPRIGYLCNGNPPLSLRAAPKNDFSEMATCLTENLCFSGPVRGLRGNHDPRRTTSFPLTRATFFEGLIYSDTGS